MIHTILSLTRPLFVLDCETTGVHKEARIIELGFQQWDATGLVKEYRHLFNPGVTIPASSTAIHNITDEMVRTSIYFWQIAQRLANGFSDCDFAGKNIRFDLGRLAYEFSLAQVAWSYAGACIVDADRLEQLAVPRDLGALHKKYTGEAHDGAHGAMSAVRASTTVIVHQLETYEALPRDLRALHELQWPGWLTTDGSFKMVDGVPRCMLKKHRDTPMDQVPMSYYDWILSADFPEDVRQLASDAKIGKFPGGNDGRV